MSSLVKSRYRMKKLAEAIKEFRQTPWTAEELVRGLGINRTTADRWIGHWLAEKLLKRIENTGALNAKGGARYRYQFL
jgi:hypothetical protein